MRYRLRTLLILLAVLPPASAVVWWKYSQWRARRAELERRSQRMIWMIGPTADSADATELLPWTVGEYEDRYGTTPAYVGIDGALVEPR